MKLLAIIAVWALALAPLATPATAAISKPCSVEMTSEHGDHGKMPAEHDANGYAAICCVGTAAALPAERMANNGLPTTKMLPAASTITKLNGIEPAAADPPPRA